MAQIYVVQPEETEPELKQEGRKEENLSLVLGNTF